MASNQASMVRRQRERERQQKRREKQARRAERREQKKAEAVDAVPIDESDPMNDPSIDWGMAVRETEVILNDNLEVVEEEEEEEEEEVQEVAKGV